jgi:hypothetical protein
MQVYGDPQYRISSKVFLSNFSERVRRTRPDRLDDLRTLFIQAGQFEQGLADAGQDAHGLTDLAGCRRRGKSSVGRLGKGLLP